jgi:hypothetical protein
MRLVDTFWLIVPGFEGGAVHWMDLTLGAGIGGVWVGAFLWRLEKRPLLPLKAPLLAEDNLARA